MPSIGFVNESKLYVRGEIDERTAILDEWLEKGHLLGNHTSPTSQLTLPRSRNTKKT